MNMPKEKTAHWFNFMGGDSIEQAAPRFYAQETIAQMPHFIYASVLYLYETLGRWRRADYIKIRFSETWNELHHLLIMEELGGMKSFFTDSWRNMLQSFII